MGEDLAWLWGQITTPSPAEQWLADRARNAWGWTFAEGWESRDPSRVGEVAERYGRSPKEVNDAIHGAKRGLPRNTPSRNPDVYVDKDGEIYPLGPEGEPGDSLGNIEDLFPPE